MEEEQYLKDYGGFWLCLLTTGVDTWRRVSLELVAPAIRYIADDVWGSTNGAHGKTQTSMQGSGA
jgi:hypothetical protein